MFPRALLAACCMAAALPVLAEPAGHDHTAAATTQWLAPVIEQAWSRAMPPSAPNGAVYFVLRNPAGMGDRLVGVSTERADKAELHAHLLDNGMMRMRPVSAVDVPAQGAVEFKPGSYHVMLFGLKQPLVAGDRFPITLQLEKAGTITGEVQVLDEAPMMEMDHSQMHMQH